MNKSYKFLNEIKDEDTCFKLKKPLKLVIQHEDNYFVIDNKKLSILAYGNDRDEVVENFVDKFMFLWMMYVKEEDEFLTSCTLSLKYYMLSLISEEIMKIKTIIEPHFINKGIGGYIFKTQEGFDSHKELSFCYEIIIKKDEKVSLNDIINKVEDTLRSIFPEENCYIWEEDIYFKNNKMYVENI